MTQVLESQSTGGGPVTASVRHSKAPYLDTYSIQLRPQRTTTEHCFVSVPVTSDIVDLQDDGRPVASMQIR